MLQPNAVHIMHRFFPAKNNAEFFFPAKNNAQFPPTKSIAQLVLIINIDV